MSKESSTRNSPDIEYKSNFDNVLKMMKKEHKKMLKEERESLLNETINERSVE